MGISIDSNLSWKCHVDYISRKVKRSIGLLSRCYVSRDTLINFYYSLIYPFLIYWIIVWGNTYTTSLNPLYILQKKAVCITTFSCFDQHSSPSFKNLRIVKFFDLVKFHILIFMYKFHNDLLPSVFRDFFISVNTIHNYNTRLASRETYYFPKVRTNYGIFNIGFQGPIEWNSINENLKSCSFALFKFKIKQSFLNHY